MVTDRKAYFLVCQNGNKLLTWSSPADQCHLNGQFWSQSSDQISIAHDQGNNVYRFRLRDGWLTQQNNFVGLALPGAKLGSASNWVLHSTGQKFVLLPIFSCRYLFANFNR